MIKIFLAAIFTVTVLDLFHVIDTPGYVDLALFTVLVGIYMGMFVTRSRKDES